MPTSSTHAQSLISIDAFTHDPQRMLNSLVDHLDGLVYCNLYDEHWTIIFASKGCKQLTGYSSEDLMFNKVISYEEMTFSEDRKMVRDTIVEATKQGRGFEIEYRIIQQNGNIIWVCERGHAVYNANGQPQAIEGFIENITKRKAMEQSLYETELKYRSMFENATEGIFQTSPNGHYLIVNPALARMYGYSSPEELIQALNNIQQQLYVESNRRDDFVKAMQENKVVQNFESLVYRKDGSTIWISENARMVHDQEGNLLYYEGTVEDITSRKNHANDIEYQATHDNLTGLPNRYMLNTRLKSYMSFADHYNTKIAVAFIDLDHFKFINDTMGHEVGDQLLLIMSKRLTNCVREIDTVVRLGGDEFVILFSNITSLNEIKPCMDRVLSAIASPCEINHLDYTVSCSVGLSLYPDDGKEASTLLKNADSAMYKAKKAGRNNFQVYTPAINEALTERVTMEYRLRGAIEQNEFILHYQPKVDFTTGLICGAEALLRWQPPNEELVSPLKFIPIAEETGLIDRIGEWVIIEACRKIKSLKDKIGYSIPIAVNVSPKQFSQPNLANSIKNILNDIGVTPEHLELEITESTLTDDAEKFISALHSLKKIGIKLAVDDFGTGYSSLAYLKDFPVDRLKIDKAFVHNLENDMSNIAILKAIIVLGQSLGMKVIAEGVETAYQYNFLKTIGCDELQGYYFSKPLPEDEFETLLINQNASRNQ